MLNDLFWKTLLRAPEDEGAGGGGGGEDAGTGGGEAGGAGGEGAGQGGDKAGDDKTADAGGQGGGGDGGGDKGAGGNWWEDRRFDADTQSQLKALGLTVEDPLDAVRSLAGMERAAKAKLGKGADRLMEKPAEGQAVSEWMRQNGEVLGIPDKPEGYEIAPPEGWPKDAGWDKEFEAKARQIAHEEGLTGQALQRFTELYAGQVSGMLTKAQEDLSAATAELMGQLQKDWGDQTGGRIALATQAAGVLAERAGLDATARENLTAVLSEKTGDANVIRLFATIGEMMGEDTATALNGGGGSLSMTPAEARARIEAMKKPDSDFAKARNDASQGKGMDRWGEMQKEWKRLHKIGYPDG